MSQAPSLPADYLQTILDAFPAMVFVMDTDMRILAVNQAAASTLGQEPKTILHRLCGEVLHCLHQDAAARRCGQSEFCSDCMIRQAVEGTADGLTTTRQRYRLMVQKGDQRRDAHFQVTATPCRYLDNSIAVIILEDITELEELRQIVPICIHCKKIRHDAEFWEHVESFIESQTRFDFSHSICPECLKLLYPDMT